MSEMPASTMKAVRFHEFGGTEVLTYEDAPRPKAGPGEALVRVKACALNDLDLWIAKELFGKVVLKP